MLRIAIAKTPELVDEVLKLRHQVWGDVWDDVWADQPDQLVQTDPTRLMDRFDTFPSTTHIVAMEQTHLIGSLRLTLNTSAGTPVSELYHLKSTPPPGRVLLSCDLHCIHPSHSESSTAAQTTLGLMLMACYVGISQQVTHIVASVHPKNVSLLEGIGFQVMAHKITQTAEKLDHIPLILNIKRDLKDAFMEFSERNELQELMHSYGCVLYRPGESILRAGTTGDCAFVIADGEVEVKHAGSQAAVDTMGVGEVFGELALLTNQVRSADIIAKTEVRAMILEKSVFVDHLMSEPKVALKLLTSMGHRMKHLIDYCNTQEIKA